LFIGVAMANAPPSVDMLGDNETEYTNFLPGDHLDLTGEVTDMIQFTANVQVSCLPNVTETNIVETARIPEVVRIGSAQANDNLDEIYPSATIWQSNTGKVLQRDHSYNRQPAGNLHPYIVMRVPFVERGCL